MPRLTGHHEITKYGDEDVRAFVPEPLPPTNPPLYYQPEQLWKAEQALSRLDVASRMVPAMDWFIYAFVRKEAVVSSQIEGTQATLTDLFDDEAGQVLGHANAPPVRIPGRGVEFQVPMEIGRAHV